MACVDVHYKKTLQNFAQSLDDYFENIKIISTIHNDSYYITHASLSHTRL